MNELPERDLPPGRHHLLREHLLTEIRQNEKKPAETPKPQETSKPRATPKPQKRWFRPALIAGAVAASVAAGVLVASPFGDRPAQAAPSAETVRMLEEIAEAARRQPAPKDLRDDQFVYVKSKVAHMSAQADKPGELGPVHQREIWLSVDGLHTEIVHEPANDLDMERLKPELPLPDADSNYRNLQKLPTDPVNMLDWLHKESQGGKSDDQNAFVLVGDLSYESLMPPKQAAALYLAASKIPGVELIEDAVDAEGRHGVAIAREDDGVREELIFDKRTKQFLGEREVVVEDTPYGAEEGDVVGRSAVLDRTVVDKAGQRP
ncbi:CU044_5270 family protein [Streptomyces sp. NPDC051214]|uniref:CU044_5270 family protein n=1 Tax=Streptomyces sp. NPDC051214 TaxID=3155282 RepID=UPI0034363A11